MTSDNSFDWSRYQIENPQEQQQISAPTSQLQQEEASQNGEFDWSQYQEEKPMTFGEKLPQDIKEAFKGYGRLGLSGLSQIYTAPFRTSGSLLQTLAKGGVEGEPGQFKGAGTRMVRKAGEYLSKKGKEEVDINKQRIEKILGKPYSKGEESIQEFTDDFGDLAGLGIPPTHAAAGAALSWVGGRLGAGEDTRETLKMIGTSIPAFYKGIQLLWKDRNFVDRIMDIFRKEPQAMGKLTGLEGAQLKAFQELSKAEQSTFVSKMLEEETNIMNQAKEQQVYADRMSSTEAARTLTGRVTEGGEELGLRPTNIGVKPSSTESNLENVLDIASKKEFGNKRVAGKNLKNTVMESDNKAYNRVNELYEKSRNLNERVNKPHIKLTHQLQDRLDQLNRIPRPSSVQNNLKNALEDIIEELAVVENGQIVGYKEINNQTLIDQIQSLRQTVDFDFEHGSPKGIFKPTISDIQDSVYTAAKGKAAESLAEANSAYREWTTNYNNDYINPYRDRSNKNYEGLLNKNLDPDHFNVVNDLVGETKAGNDILKSTQREIVEKKLRKFVEKPDLVRSRDFRKAMTELESVLSPDQVKAVRAEMESQVSAKFRRKVSVPEKIEKAAAKYSNKTPAVIRERLTTPEGIAELKTDLSKTKNGKAIFDDLGKRKIKSILSEGKIKADFNGKDLYKVLNNEKNYSLIEALTSPEEAEAALNAAEALSKKKFTAENLNALSKKLMKYKLIHFLVF